MSRPRASGSFVSGGQARSGWASTRTAPSTARTPDPSRPRHMPGSRAGYRFGQALQPQPSSAAPSQPLAPPPPDPPALIPPVMSPAEAVVVVVAPMDGVPVV